MKRDTELPDIYSWVVCDVCGEWCHPTEVSFRYDDCEEEVVCDECRPTLRAVDGAIAPTTGGDLPADVLAGEGALQEPPRQ